MSTINDVREEQRSLIPRRHETDVLGRLLTKRQFWVPFNVG